MFRVNWCSDINKKNNKKFLWKNINIIYAVHIPCREVNSIKRFLCAVEIHFWTIQKRGKNCGALENAFIKNSSYVSEPFKFKKKNTSAPFYIESLYWKAFSFLVWTYVNCLILDIVIENYIFIDPFKKWAKIIISSFVVNSYFLSFFFTLSNLNLFCIAKTILVLRNFSSKEVKRILDFTWTINILQKFQFYTYFLYTYISHYNHRTNNQKSLQRVTQYFR